LLMPSLLRVAAEPAPSRTLVEELSKTVEEALSTAEEAGYRIDALLGSADISGSVESEPLPPKENAPSVEGETEQLIEPGPVAEEPINPPTP